MKKFSYKAGILTGLFLYACGAALFWPAAEVMNYTLFLIGLFIIAAGLGCLETAAKPVCHRPRSGKRRSLPP
ncbi:L-fucose transporter [Klebsiella pneumoniae]|uniref:L-fucose transporter n=1 Tax=Klebsiella pneumoniae TaxID=573 RepID=A0A3S4GK20_KLEPN|nr:L-fucose transporter [Klebsiella pneumoniae]